MPQALWPGSIRPNHSLDLCPRWSIVLLVSWRHLQFICHWYRCSRLWQKSLLKMSYCIMSTAVHSAVQILKKCDIIYLMYLCFLVNPIYNIINSNVFFPINIYFLMEILQMMLDRWLWALGLVTLSLQNFDWVVVEVIFQRENPMHPMLVSIYFPELGGVYL